MSFPRKLCPKLEKAATVVGPLLITLGDGGCDLHVLSSVDRRSSSVDHTRYLAVCIQRSAAMGDLA